MLLEQVDCENITGLGEQVLDTAHRVYRRLGPEHSKDVYLDAFCHELGLREISCQRDMWLPEMLHGCPLNVGDVADVFAGDCVVVQVIAAREISEEEEQRLMALLSRSKRPLGYVINFGARTFDSAVRKLYYDRQPLKVE